MDTKEETKSQAPEVAGAGGALAQLEHDPTRQVITWTRERVELLKREVCPSGITDDEFALFLERCKRSQMDPLMGEADCVPRRTKVGEDEYGGPKYITKHVFQMREQGMEARADRFPDFRGITGEAVYDKDVCDVDMIGGRVLHKFDATKPRGKLIGAWAKCVREGREPFVVFIAFEERAQYKFGKGGVKVGLTETWLKMPETMIRKCARFDVLKRAYPNTYNGLTIDAEYSPPERDVTPGAEESSSSAAGAAGLADRMKAKVEVFPFVGKFAGVEYKGRPLAEVPDPALHEAIKHAEASVKKEPKATWAKTFERGVELCRAELSKRGPTSSAPAKPEPEDAEIVEDLHRAGGVEPGSGG